MFLGATQPLQCGVVHRRRDEWDGELFELGLVEERHFRAAVDDEQEPTVLVDRPSHGGAELVPEEVLIRLRLTVAGLEVSERGRVVPEVELDAKLLQQVRAEEKVDVKLLLPGDEKLHLVVRHDGYGHVADPDRTNFEVLEDGEVHGDRLSEKSGEGAFERT